MFYVRLAPSGGKNGPSGPTVRRLSPSRAGPWPTPRSAHHRSGALGQSRHRRYGQRSPPPNKPPRRGFSMAISFRALWPLPLLVSTTAAFYPDAVGIHGLGGFGGPRALGGKAMDGTTIPPMPRGLIAFLALLVIAAIAFMIYLIVRDEREESKRVEEEKRVRGLKFGRMDPRYHTE